MSYNSKEVSETIKIAGEYSLIKLHSCDDANVNFEEFKSRTIQQISILHWNIGKNGFLNFIITYDVERVRLYILSDKKKTETIEQFVSQTNENLKCEILGEDSATEFDGIFSKECIQIYGSDIGIENPYLNIKTDFPMNQLDNILSGIIAKKIPVMILLKIRPVSSFKSQLENDIFTFNKNHAQKKDEAFSEWNPVDVIGGMLWVLANKATDKVFSWLGRTFNKISSNDFNLSEMYFFSIDNKNIKSYEKKKEQDTFFSVQLSLFSENLDAVNDSFANMLRSLQFNNGIDTIFMPGKAKPYFVQDLAKHFLSPHSKGAIFGEKELFTLFNVPINSSVSCIEKNYARAIDIDQRATRFTKGNGDMLIGEGRTLWLRQKVYVPFEDRFRHMYVIGKSGMGKSVLLGNMAIQDVQNWFGVCILDPHGDFVNDVLPFVPKERLTDLHIINVSSDRNFWFNPLFIPDELPSEEFQRQKEGIITEMRDVFINIYWEDVFPALLQDCLSFGIELLVQPWYRANLLELPTLYNNPWFLGYKFSQFKSKLSTDTQEYFKKMYDDMNSWSGKISEIQQFFKSKFSFVNDSKMKTILTQSPSWRSMNMLDFNSIINNWKLLFLKLNRAELWEHNASVLGALITFKIHKTIMQRTWKDKSSLRPFFLYLDEAQNFLKSSEKLESILSEARKYRLGLILAHQYMGQLKGTDNSGKDLLSAITGNVGTKVSFQIWSDDAERLKTTLGLELNDMIYTKKFHFYTQVLINNESTQTFLVKSLPPRTDFLLPLRSTNDIMKLESGIYERRGCQNRNEVEQYLQKTTYEDIKKANEYMEKLKSRKSN